MFFTAEYERCKQVGERERRRICAVSHEGKILDKPPCHLMGIIYSEKYVVCFFFSFPLALATLHCVWVIFLFLVIESGCDLDSVHWQEHLLVMACQTHGLFQPG